MTITDGRFADLAWRDLYVVENMVELGTEDTGAAARWDWVDLNSRVAFAMDPEIKIVGQSALRALVKPYGGERVSLRFPAANDLKLDLKGKITLVFWIKVLNENVPAWQNANPVVTLYESPSRIARLEAGDLLSSPPYNEARCGWTYMVVPLRSDSLWKRKGADIATVNSVIIGFDSWDAPPCKSGSTASPFSSEVEPDHRFQLIRRAADNPRRDRAAAGLRDLGRPQSRR